MEFSSLTAIRPKVKPLCERTEEEKRIAERNDAESHGILRKLARMPQNLTCGDCGALRPGWCALPHGVFLCIECAQVHRSLGRHISQVKSFSTGTYLWYSDEIECLRLMGNAKVNALFLPGLDDKIPRRGVDSGKQIADHIREKYSGKYFCEKPSKLFEEEPDLISFDSEPSKEQEYVDFFQSFGL